MSLRQPPFGNGPPGGDDRPPGFPFGNGSVGDFPAQSSSSSIETLDLIQVVRYSLLAVMCVLVYEWLENLEDERRLIHRARWSSVKATYLLCRYYPLCYWVVALWAYCLDHKPTLCRAVLKPIHALLAPFQFFPQAVLFMRAYAFSGRNRWVLAVLTIEYLLVVGADIHLFFVDVPVPALNNFGLLLLAVGGSGCFPDYSTKAMGRRIGFAILASTLLDLSSLTIVLWYCYRSHIGDTSLARFFLRQGLAAFVWVGAVNIVSTVVYFRARSAASGIGLPFSLVISNIIACRLILALRRHTYRPSVFSTRMNMDMGMGMITSTGTTGRWGTRSLWRRHQHQRHPQAPSVDIWAVPATAVDCESTRSAGGDGEQDQDDAAPYGPRSNYASGTGQPSTRPSRSSPSSSPSPSSRKREIAPARIRGCYSSFDPRSTYPPGSGLDEGTGLGKAGKGKWRLGASTRKLVEQTTV